MLKLSAADADDLQVISAHMQDALVRVADITYLKKRHQFALVANRYAWEIQGATERRRSGLHVNHVLAVKRLGLAYPEPEAILSLLSITLPEPETLLLTFSAGISFRLSIEYLELQMRDLGPSWGASQAPAHET
jgi:Protein of unknown function (DUF2948)